MSVTDPILVQWAFTILVALGLLGGIGLGIKAILDRRSLQAKAGSDDASAASVVAAAARELIDPLRRELAQERAEHAEEIALERKKVAAMRRETEAALNDVTTLRATLRRALEEVEKYKTRNLELERELERLKEAQALNNPGLDSGGGTP